jgi:SnoaL-like polyketide cyclase
MSPDEMGRLFERHRDAEAARDYDAILATFVEDCFLETHPLGLRSEGRVAVRKAYEEGFFAAFPDLAPDDEGRAFGDDVMVVWGILKGSSGGDWMGVPPSGRSFTVPFANVTPFRDGLMAGESIYFDLVTLCEQAALPLDQVRAGARERAEVLRSPGG